MEIKVLEEDKNSLKILVDSNEESLFSLLKVYLDKEKEVDFSGVVKDHYLIDETEFYIKVNSGSPKSILVKTLDKVKKELKTKIIK